jgi:hypothetical protein
MSRFCCRRYSPAPGAIIRAGDAVPPAVRRPMRRAHFLTAAMSLVTTTTSAPVLGLVTFARGGRQVVVEPRRR